MSEPKSAIEWFRGAYPYLLKAGMNYVARKPERRAWRIDRQPKERLRFLEKDKRHYKTFYLICPGTGAEQELTAVLTVDLEGQCIAWQGTTSSRLLNPQAYGSEIYTLAALTGPLVLPLTPLLLGINAYYTVQERRKGMSRYAIALLDDLEGQLTLEEQTLLTEVFKNEWHART